MNDDRRVIVIGSGPSGAMAALTLLQQGIPVTMLESGQSLPRGLLLRILGRNVYRIRPPLKDHKRHVSSGDPRARWHHALVPGGLSNYWTGAVPRFAPQDFSEGERLHERYRWPISYEDLVPYYQRVERLLGVVAAREDVPNLPASLVAHERRLPEDWQRLATSAGSFGHGLTPLPLADGRPWMIARTGAAFNSFTRLLPTLQRSSRFQLLLGAHALCLEWRGDKSQVSSVIYFDHATRSEQRVTGAAVVVAAGPLSSTKLLMNSACTDFPDGLGDTEGLLGRYLHDHAEDFFLAELNPALSRLGQAAYLTRAPYRESAPLLATSCTVGSASTLEKILAITPLRTRTFGVKVFGTMVPAHENHVSLHPKLKDEFGFPMLDIHIRYDHEVLRNMMMARERLGAILESAGYHCTVRSPVADLVPGNSVHYGGTVRMHQSPKHGLLDAWSRLHTVHNVVVADASSFTTGVEKNPTLTVMALAARAAHRLAEDLRRA